MPDKQPIDSGIVSLISGAVNYQVNGISVSSGWLSPGQPPLPIAQDQAHGRRFDFVTGYNYRLQPRTEEAITYLQLRSLADTYDILRLAIETRKDQMAKLKFNIQRVDGEEVVEPDERVKGLRDFLRYPDQEHDWSTWLRMALEEMFVTDATTIMPVMSIDKSMVARLELIDGTTIKRVLDAQGRTPTAPSVAYQQVIKGLPTVDYHRDELIFRPRNPRTHKVYGYSAVEQIVMTVNIALRRQLHQLEYYTEGSVPDAFLSVPKEWSTNQIKDYQDYFDQLMADGTATRRKARFVPGDMKYQATKEMVLKDPFDEWLARVVCYCFSLSPTAFVRETNRATAETAHETALEEGLAPIMLWVESLINYMIMKYWGYADIRFAWDTEKVVDAKVRADIHQIYVTAKVMTPDEVREELGMDALTAEQKTELTPPEPLPGEPGGPTLPAAPATKVDVHLGDTIINTPDIKMGDTHITTPDVKIGDTIVDVGATTIKAEFPAPDKKPNTVTKTITATRVGEKLVGEIKETIDG